MSSSLQRLHLVHQLIVDVQAAGGVDDEHVTAGIDGFAARFLRQSLDGRGIGFADFALVNVGLDRLGDNFQLLTRGGTVNVNRNQQRAMAAILQPVRQLARGSGLTGTLQAGHQHHRRWLRGKLDLGGVVAQHLDQFIAQNLDDLFGGGKRGRNLLSDGLLLDVVDQLLDDLEVDVGLKQRQTNLRAAPPECFLR